MAAEEFTLFASYAFETFHNKRRFKKRNRVIYQGEKACNCLSKHPECIS